MSQDIEFTIVFDAQTIIVRHKPNYISRYDHFEFLSPDDPAKPIPISETGYRSLFVPHEEVASAPSVETYACAIVVALMHAQPKADPKQLVLF